VWIGALRQKLQLVAQAREVDPGRVAGELAKAIDDMKKLASTLIKVQMSLLDVWLNKIKDFATVNTDVE
jgi:hypothetical protein